MIEVILASLSFLYKEEKLVQQSAWIDSKEICMVLSTSVICASLQSARYGVCIPGCKFWHCHSPLEKIHAVLHTRDTNYKNPTGDDLTNPNNSDMLSSVCFGRVQTEICFIKHTSEASWCLCLSNECRSYEQ